MQIDDSVVLVSGGSSGLGRATAERVLAAGARVVLADLPSSDGEAVASGLGERAVFAATDVTSEEQVQAAVNRAAELGPLRVAVCCAGIAPPARVVGRRGPHPLDLFRSVIEVNLIGSFNVLRLAAAQMAEQDEVDGERGVVVMTASVAAYEGQIGQSAYAASKGGVVGLTLCAARDLAERRIRVMSVAPGTFETPMLAGLSEEARDSLGEQVPHPSRLGDPAEYAALVEHIVANPMLNGETIRIDGALRMGPR